MAARGLTSGVCVICACTLNSVDVNPTGTLHDSLCLKIKIGEYLHRVVDL